MKNLSSPFIPEKVFNNLPPLLAKPCATIKDKRERDVFLTGALGMLSACLPNTSGVYDRSTYYPNLYTLVSAPPASGKGVLNLAKKLGLARHELLVSKSHEAREKYKEAMRIYERDLTNYQEGTTSPPPIEPKSAPFKMLFIPSNSNSAMLARQLKNSDNQGILFETSAISLSPKSKKDWGQYSDILRKAAHHESFLYSTKLKGKSVKVTTPRLSIVLAALPSELTDFISSVEDSLFSQFLFYSYEPEVKWKYISMRAPSRTARNRYKKLSAEVLTMHAFLEKHPTTFDLREDQWSLLNYRFSKTMERINEQVGKEAITIVKRMGVNLFRIAMILSTLRKFETENTAKVIICNDADFYTALSLMDTFLEHTLGLYDSLSVNKVSTLAS